MKESGHEFFHYSRIGCFLQVALKSAKTGGGRPPKNLGTDVATPQGLIETPQMLLGIKDKRRQYNVIEEAIIT